MLSDLDDRLLSAIEQRELTLLSWGYVDGVVTHGEAAAIADQAGIDSFDERFERLQTQKLIFVAAGGFRTRFATTVRLLALNRQLFHGGNWRTSPSLIDAFRVASRPRRFPRRDLGADEVIAQLGVEPGGAGGRAIEAMMEGGAIQLAGFQVRGAARIRSHLRQPPSPLRGSGTLISAGTGGGKTKAFYLPLLLHIAEQEGPSDRTVALAIYPRNELLKDQLREAIRQSDLVHGALGSAPSVGAYFGPTIRDTKLGTRSSGWSDALNGVRTSTYLFCPQPECDSALQWKAPFPTETLVCPTCGWRSKEGQVRLTRQSIKQRPPNILLTTIEMVNRLLADASSRSVLVGEVASPAVLLLDEAHLYTGTSGALAALTLRRWQNALRGPRPHVVGLSATLDRPREHLAGLAGVSLEDIDVIEPSKDELDAQSAEHTILLRSDPTSGTSTMSATVQTIFLVERMMERWEGLSQKSGTSGTKTFAFANSLDNVNRLYWAVRDAERGASHPPRAPLASLRSDLGDDRHDREASGQNWRPAAALSGSLDTPLRVALTSSQRTGVDSTADVVVASSSLEVGFDDPEVGAVVQHQTTRDSAALIQRRGRAGRKPHMRPLTAIVLSDFGRDRSSFLGFERLLEPTVPFNPLPTASLFVLRVQAAWALLDWLATKVQGLNAWTDLSSDAHGNQGRRQQSAKILEAVLVDEATRNQFERHLRGALGVESETTLNAILWGQPRGLMTSVVPTLLRQIASGWTTARGERDYFVDHHPLPSHVPSATFADLNVPEVLVELQDASPAGGDNYSGDPIPRLPIDQALAYMRPGNPTRRFATDHFTQWHWVPADALGRSIEYPGVLDDLAATVPSACGTSELRLMRPYRIHLSRTQNRTDQRWNSRPIWSSLVSGSEDAPTANAEPVALLASRRGNRPATSITFMTHSLGCAPIVARALVGADAVSPDGVRHEQSFCHAGEPVAIGYRETVDACFIAAPTDPITFVELGEAAARALRTMHFDAALIQHQGLRDLLSDFDILGIRQYLRLALAAAADADKALDQLCDDPQALVAAVLKAMQTTAHAGPTLQPGQEPEGPDDPDPENPGARWQRLSSFMNDNPLAGPTLVDALRSARDPSDAQLASILNESQRITLAAVVRDALNQLNPNIGADELQLDVEIVDRVSDAPKPGEERIWMCEPGVGSIGVLDELRTNILDDPRRFADLVEAAAGPSTVEIADAGLRAAVSSAATDPGGAIGAAFAAVRTATSIETTSAALQALSDTLKAQGLLANSAMMSTLSLRILRPGSSHETDSSVTQLLSAWDELERQLNLELDPQEVAYAAPRRLGGAGDIDRSVSLLWPRGRMARTASLNAWSRFNRAGVSDLADRLMLQHRFSEDTPSIAIADENWIDLLKAKISNGHARLIAPAPREKEIAVAALGATCIAFDARSVLARARIVGVGREGDLVYVDLEVRELAQ